MRNAGYRFPEIVLAEISAEGKGRERLFMNTERFKPAEMPSGMARQSTITENLFLQLRKDIINGRYPPGSKLGLDKLRTAYGAGSSPLREALSRLAALGLVRQEVQRGFSVAPASVEDLRDIGENRILFEAIALRQAIEQGDDDWECRILSTEHLLSKKKYSQIGKDNEANRAWERCHRDFHTSLIEACNSYWLLHFCGLLYDQYDRYRRMVADHGQKRAKLDQEHQEILRLTLNRKTDQACDLLVDHIRSSMDIVLSGFKVLP